MPTKKTTTKKPAPPTLAAVKTARNQAASLTDDLSAALAQGLPVSPIVAELVKLAEVCDG